MNGVVPRRYAAMVLLALSATLLTGCRPVTRADAGAPDVPRPEANPVPVASEGDGDPTGPSGPVPVMRAPRDLWAPTAGTTPERANYVYLESEAGDPLGAGRRHTYTQADAGLSLWPTGGRVAVGVAGEESWSGTFTAMAQLTKLAPGFYEGLTGHLDPLKGSLEWSWGWRTCGELTGWFTVDRVRYEGDTLTALDLRFEQRCAGATGALHGEIRWRATDRTKPPGPVDPPPADLWRPPAGTTPATGNYIYLQSDAGDFPGGGRTVTLTAADAVEMKVEGTRLWVGAARGNWNGELQTMSGLTRVKRGYYEFRPQPEDGPNPTRTRFVWASSSVCTATSGWVAVDRIRYEGERLAALDLRFEQHCQGVEAALRGQIHWEDRRPPATPPGPVPPPRGLWAPAPGTTPATGTYVHLQADAGDPVLGGTTVTRTPLDALIDVRAEGNELHVGVRDAVSAYGAFAAKDGQARLEPGFYGDLRQFSDRDRTRGGLTWSSRWSCPTSTGWFVIDQVRYDGDTLTAIDLRFEQHCEDRMAALRGKIHWEASDTRTPPGPVVPPPDDLWRAADAAYPKVGNYVHLHPDAGEYIGQGRDWTYTPTYAVLRVEARGNEVQVTVLSDRTWIGTFRAGEHQARLVPGYYEVPLEANVVRGALAWSGDGRSCVSTSGWFVVDHVAYDGDAVVALDVRFEQHCSGAEAALRGQIHWTAGG